MKSCPQCSNIDVPDMAEQCPFCGYTFVAKKEEEIPVEPISSSEPQSLDSFSKDTQKKENDTISSTKQSSDTMKKKSKHGLRNFVIIIVIAVVVYFQFTDNTHEKDKEENKNAESLTVNTNEQNENITTNEQSSEQESQKKEPINEREVLLSQVEYADQYILPLSDRIYLNTSDLVGLSEEELRLARNEIYARHGRLFNDEELQRYFNNCDWYLGTIPADEFSESVFNEYEDANVDLIKSYEFGLRFGGKND